MKLFRRSSVLISSLSLLLTLSALSEDLDKLKCTSLNQLIGRGLLNINVYGTGGNEGECIFMCLKNPSSDTAFIWIEPGRVLSSLDSSVQDILITREELLVLVPGENRDIDIYGFCCQALKASPDSAEMFRVGEMADSSVVALAEFLNERDNDFPEDAIQKAIWCLTDDYSVSDIYGEDLASIADLRNLVASLKGLDEQWYNTENVPGEGDAFSYYSKTISGEVEIFIPTDCILNIYICDEEGTKWDEFERNVPYKAGTYQYSFKLTTTNWPSGKYFICIMADGELLFKKEFEL
jgi:hypothetical protein